MSGAQLYDTIGATYTVTRRTEPRIAARIWAALGDARTRIEQGKPALQPKGGLLGPGSGSRLNTPTRAGRSRPDR
jgi:hypothetical protein